MTEIVRVVGKARRSVTNAFTNMESRLQSYNEDIIGDIGAKVDTLSRKEIQFSETIQDIQSTFTNEYEHEFEALVHRLDLEPEDHMS